MQITKPIKQIKEFPSNEVYNQKPNKNANKFKFYNPVTKFYGSAWASINFSTWKTYGLILVDCKILNAQTIISKVHQPTTIFFF